MLPPLVKLATSAAPGEAKYVCLAGAGLSKDAGLPTDWDLMIETAALLRVAEEDDGTALQTWFLASPNKDMKYSELIGGLFNSSVEQQNFIRDKLKAEKPGEAHLLLAELAKRKVLRCIITTNFDDLIEQALQQVGLSVQVIANDDDLKHSEPLIHCKQFRVYKPHGTLGVGRLRNTPADLQKLSPRMERELVRILHDHGLIVLGYAGADESILNVFRKRKQRFYPTFLVNPSEPPEAIPPYFASETFNYVPCRGASAFLTDLLETHRRLAALGPTSGMPAVVAEFRDALRSGRSNVGAAVRSFMAQLTDELKKISPDLSAARSDEALLDALDRSKPLCCEFANVANAIAEHNNSESAITVYKAFSGILEEYNVPPGASGSYFHHQFDFFKFIGHELLVNFISYLMREERWESITEILSEGVFVRNAGGHKADTVTFEYFSELLYSLEQRNALLSPRRLCLHSDILKDRHTEGDLAKLAPHEPFMEADYLLSMRAIADAKGRRELYWRPWSVVHMSGTGPRFLIEAKRKSFVKRLAPAVGVRGIEELRQLAIENHQYLMQLFGRGLWWTAPIGIEPALIGTQ
jgi:hypothetical protein